MTATTAASTVNPFWACVCQCPSLHASRSIAAPDLGTAAAAAFRSTDPRYAFRRPRELVDLDGRFRHFAFDGRLVVGKRTTRQGAIREVRNGRCAARRLATDGRLVPLVPDIVPDATETGALLISDDRGPSLAHDPSSLPRLLPWRDLIERLGSLLDAGVEWPGFLPRNVIPDGHGRFVLIDWESCRFAPRGSRHRTTIGDLTLLFWTIGWAGFWHADAESFQEQLCRALGLTVRRDPLDSFERVYAAMVGLDVDEAEVRHRCSEATLATESPGPRDAATEENRAAAGHVSLGRANVGHLLNELLPPHVSVLYTFASHDYLRCAGPAAYDRFVDLVTNVLVLGTPCEGLEHDPRRREQLQCLLLGAITAVLLEHVDPLPLLDAETTNVLLAHLCDRSATVTGLLDMERSASNGSAALMSPSISRFLELSARCLGLGRQRQSSLGKLASDVVSLAPAAHHRGRRRRKSEAPGA